MNSEVVYSDFGGSLAANGSMGGGPRRGEPGIGFLHGGATR